MYSELDGLINNNVWFRYFIEIYNNRVRDKGGWIDFESEISHIIKNLDSARHTLKEQLNEGKTVAEMTPAQYGSLEKFFFMLFGKLYEKLDDPIFYLRHQICIKHLLNKEYIKFIKNKSINDLNNLIRCLEIYLSDYISFDQCIPLKDIAELHIDGVLSFNYTDTYKLLYDTPNSNIEYDFIHGKADLSKNVEECSLVLGIDEYLSGEEKNKDNEFIQFKKFYQRIYKGTGCHYKDWLHGYMGGLNQRIPNVYIYGHSLDVTDADILRQLILTKGATTTIFYHNKDAMGSQIANLVKVIGEDELIKRTDGSHPTIIFKQSSTETVKTVDV